MKTNSSPYAMNLELQEYLYRRYPKLFREPEGAIHKGPIDEWGIECGDEWFDLVNYFSRACESEIEALASRGIAQDRWPRVRQIKEKLEGLRFYVLPPISEELRDKVTLAAMAENIRICERCGAVIVAKVLAHACST